jgi:hypothetical protein
LVQVADRQIPTGFFVRGQNDDWRNHVQFVARYGAEQDRAQLRSLSRAVQCCELSLYYNSLRICGARRHQGRSETGLRWEEIDANLILRHRLSKSIHGAATIMDPEAGRWKAWDLHEYPMVMDELAWLCGGTVDRALLPAAGPVIVNPGNRLPWSVGRFRANWRALARAARVPDEIQNRDSRSGAATEADVAGAPEEKIKRGLGHSKKETTRRYLREDIEINSEVARLRAKKRKP